MAGGFQAARRIGNGSRDAGVVADDLEAPADAVGGLMESLSDRNVGSVSGEDSGLRFGTAEAAGDLGVESAVSLPAGGVGGRVSLVGRGAVRVSLPKLKALRDSLGKRPSRKDAAPMRLAVARPVTYAFAGGAADRLA